ncbi:MAG: hypothetical protein R3C44_15125 [Chloroflexota bacterium]
MPVRQQRYAEAGSVHDYTQKRIDFLGGPTSPANATYWVYLYSTELENPEPRSMSRCVSGMLPARSSRHRVPCSCMLPTRRLKYANTVQYNENSVENEVYWDTTWGWIPKQVMTMDIEPNTAPVDLNIQVATTENDNDARPIVITVEAGGVSEELVLYKEQIKDMASVVNFTLENIPVGTDQVTVTYYSPGPNDPAYNTGPEGGDSSAFLGVAANYECALP